MCSILQLPIQHTDPVRDKNCRMLGAIVEHPEPLLSKDCSEKVLEVGKNANCQSDRSCL